MNTQHSASPASRVAGYAGLVVHGLLVVPLLAMGLVAPMWGVGLLLATWALLLALGIRLVRERPSVVPGIPILMIAVAIGLVMIGDALLGWTA